MIRWFTTRAIVPLLFMADPALVQAEASATPEIPLDLLVLTPGGGRDAGTNRPYTFRRLTER